MIKESICFLGMVIVVSLVGCQPLNTKPKVEPMVATIQSQETRVLAMAREYLDKKILGTPGESAKWNLKAHRVDDVWVVPIPADVQKGMPGGFPDKVIVNLAKNSVTTTGPRE